MLYADALMNQFFKELYHHLMKIEFDIFFIRAIYLRTRSMKIECTNARIKKLQRKGAATYACGVSDCVCRLLALPLQNDLHVSKLHLSGQLLLLN